MTMHLLPIYYTTTKTSRKSKSKNQKVMSSHDVWLMKRGLHPDQIKIKKDKALLKSIALREAEESLRVDRSDYKSSGLKGIASPAPDRSIMKRLHTEPEHVRKEILNKASRIAPLYSKGPTQYITDGADPTDIGKKK